LSYRVGSYVYAHALNDKVRIHYDHGFVKVDDKDINFYGSLDFRKKWTDVNAKVGFSYVWNKANINFRLRVDEDKTVTLYHKTLLKLN